MINTPLNSNYHLQLIFCVFFWEPPETLLSGHHSLFIFAYPAISHKCTMTLLNYVLHSQLFSWDLLCGNEFLEKPLSGIWRLLEWVCLMVIYFSTLKWILITAWSLELVISDILLLLLGSDLATFTLSRTEILVLFEMSVLISCSNRIIISCMRTSEHDSPSATQHLL